MERNEDINPYETNSEPVTAQELHAEETVAPSKDFRNATWLGLFAGALVGLLIFWGFMIGEKVANGLPQLLLVYGAPALAWCASFVCMLHLMNGLRIGPQAKLFWSIGLTIPAYILYVPTCTITGVTASEITGFYSPYTPGPIAMMLASAGCFGIILLFFVAVLKKTLGKKPVASEANPEQQESSTQ